MSPDADACAREVIRARIHALLAAAFAEIEEREQAAQPESEQEKEREQ